MPFKCMVFCQGKVWVFPWRSRCPVTIDRQGNVETVTDLRDACWPLLEQESKAGVMHTVTQATSCGDALLLTLNNNFVCMYTPATGECRMYSTAGRNLVEGEKVALADGVDTVYFENHFRTLPWLKAMLLRQVQQQASTAPYGGEGMAGARIHRYYKQILADHQGAP